MLRELTGIRRIVIKTGKTDLRMGITGLASLVRLEYGMNALEEGTIFLFCGNRRDRIKGLFYENGGWVLLYVRLSRGSVFQWPRDEDDAREITREQYLRLLDGFTLEGSIKMNRKQ